MSLARVGRWVRVEKDSGGSHVLNLDHVESIWKGAAGANFQMSGGNVILTKEPFEDTCLRVMVAEQDILPQPTPPLSRDQLAMFPPGYDAKAHGYRADPAS